MKKKVIALLVACLIIISAMGVAVSAEERVVLDNSAFYVNVPENYMYYTDDSDNFCIMDNGYGMQEVEFFIQGNLMFPKGIADASAEEIIAKVRRITQWSATIDVENLERTRVNGQRTVILECVDDSLGETYYDFYLFATKEIVSVIKVSYYDEEGRQDVQAMLNSFVLNGTRFEGDKPVKDHDFSKSPDYYEAVKGVSEAFYEYDETFDEVMWAVFGVFGLVMLLFPAVIIALIVIILKWRKSVRLSKEYESYFGSIEQARSAVNAQRMYYNNDYTAYPQQAAPYGTYPQAQPMYYQPVAQQPVPQQSFEQPAPQTNDVIVLNGENQDQM
ncbi:MAG: hypothetical protein J6Q83_07710 [Clostridia bacterium]|nr:hypothetical protein [Clostridia bacterium]